MKRIEFIAPVESMRGNLSGYQKLEYAEHNNPAFDAPVGQVNYARNYQPRFIGAKRAASGLKYFAVRTKNAVNLTTRAKMVMALLGGAGACRAAILANSTIMASLETIYAAAKAAGTTTAKNISKYIFEIVYAGLESKSVMFSFLGGESGQLYVRNPWVYTNQGAGVAISIKNSILVKFWVQLATNPLVFYVDGTKAVAHTGDKFSNIVDRRYNILGIEEVTVDGVNYAGFNNGTANELVLGRIIEGARVNTLWSSTIVAAEYITASGD